MEKLGTKIEFCGSINVSENLLENQHLSDVSYLYLFVAVATVICVY